MNSTFAILSLGAVILVAIGVAVLARSTESWAKVAALTLARTALLFTGALLASVLLPVVVDAVPQGETDSVVFTVVLGLITAAWLFYLEHRVRTDLVLV